MTRHDIISLPNKTLRKRSRRIKVFDAKLEQLCSNMEAAALDWEDHRRHEIGVALAAPQLNRLLRAVIVRNDFDDKDDRTFLPLINPQIIRRMGRQLIDYEGCLSVPDIYGRVSRYEKVKIKAQDLRGQEFRLTAVGFLARVLQHEIDHTEGVMFVDYLKDDRQEFFRLDDDGKLIQLEEAEVARQADILWN